MAMSESSNRSFSTAMNPSGIASQNGRVSQRTATITNATMVYFPPSGTGPSAFRSSSSVSPPVMVLTFGLWLHQRNHHVSGNMTTANGSPTFSHSKNVNSRPSSDWEKPASRTLGGVPTSVATPPMVAA